MGFLVGTTSNPPVAQRAGGTLDWMHILFVGGCWNHDVRRFFKCIRASLKIRFSHVAEYMEGWKLPACLHNTVNVKNIFSDTREDAMDRATGIKGSASEFLSVYAILRRFIEVIVVGAFPGNVMARVQWSLHFAMLSIRYSWRNVAFARVSNRVLH